MVYMTQAQAWVHEKLIHALTLYSERKFLTYITDMFKKVDFTHPCVYITKKSFLLHISNGDTV